MAAKSLHLFTAPFGCILRYFNNGNAVSFCSSSFLTVEMTFPRISPQNDPVAASRGMFQLCEEPYLSDALCIRLYGNCVCVCVCVSIVPCIVQIDACAECQLHIHRGRSNVSRGTSVCHATGATRFHHQQSNTLF